jgi:hypothetical protein
MKVNSGGPFLKGRRIGVDKNRFKARESEREIEKRRGEKSVGGVVS